MNKLKLAGSLMTLAFAVYANGASAALHDLPFKGENFADNEKLFTTDHAVNTSQKFGYDISARRYDFTNNRWTSVNTTVDAYNASPTNDKHAVYNKKIYAMREGKIIGCWRNAPANPRPKISGDSDVTKPWLHDKFKQGYIPGGGNMLWVEHSDGSRMLYAHMITGSISASLCPNSDQYFAAPLGGNSEFIYVGVPLAQQVTVHAGDYLGRVGNAGNSTGPHLHIHLQNSSGVGQQISFKRGIASPISDNNPYGSWTSFAGGNIPNGNTLFWAPHTLSSQYVRHGFSASGFQAMFTHLADSGYKASWLDGYRVGNDDFYNMVWKPANVAWRAYAGRSSASYQAVFDQAINDGYVPVQVDSHKSKYGPRFSAIFEKKSLATLARHNITYAQHIDAMNQAKALGMSPVSISVLSDNGGRKYTVLYSKTNIGSWVISSQLTSAAYQNKVDEQKALGRRPVYLNSYVHGGTVYYTAIFAQYPLVNWAAKHGLTSSGFQTYFNSYSGQGYLTDVVSGIDGYAYHRFSGLWHKNIVARF